MKTFTWIPIFLISSINELTQTDTQDEIKESVEGWR